MIVVSNASPIISLSKIKSLDLFPALYKKLFVPKAVFNEIVSYRDRPGVSEITIANWVKTVEVSNHLAVQLLRQNLDAGESEAIVLGLELKANLLLIDEAKGRRVAQSQGLKSTGVVGMLVAAKKQGLIRKVTPLLNALIASGFRMSNELYQTAIILAKEEN